MTEGMHAHLSLCNKLPQNVMLNNSNSFIISPHTTGWLGSAGWFYCCSHLSSATRDHSQMVMGLHSHVLCLRGSGRSLGSARAPPCKSRASPSLWTISNRAAELPTELLRAPQSYHSYWSLLSGYRQSQGEPESMQWRTTQTLWFQRPGSSLEIGYHKLQH